MQEGGLPGRVTAETSLTGAAGRREWCHVLSGISTAEQGKEEALCQLCDLTSLVGRAIFHNSLYHKF